MKSWFLLLLLLINCTKKLPFPQGELESNLIGIWKKKSLVLKVGESFYIKWDEPFREVGVYEKCENYLLLQPTRRTKNFYPIELPSPYQESLTGKERLSIVYPKGKFVRSIGQPELFREEMTFTDSLLYYQYYEKEKETFRYYATLHFSPCLVSWEILKAWQKQDSKWVEVTSEVSFLEMAWDLRENKILIISETYGSQFIDARFEKRD